MTADYVILSGGVGGAKLVRGMAEILSAERFSVIVNTGDDFEHLGLPISPDLDTLMYTLAGIVNPETGWGQKNESWDFMAALEALDGDAWFRLGDRDLATHARRLELLNQGLPLSAATAQLCQHFNVPVRLLPMSDQTVRTTLATSHGQLGFQDYFVRLQTEPAVTSIHYSGCDTALPSPGIAAELEAPGLRGIVIGPSNPWLSIDPILSVPALKPMIANSKAPVVAISPIVSGRAIKGPTAKLMREMELEVSVVGIARHYRNLLDGLILDEQDAHREAEIAAMGIATHVTQTIMRSLEDKAALARDAVTFLETLNAKQPKTDSPGHD